MGNFIRFDRVKHYYGPDGKSEPFLYYLILSLSLTLLRTVDRKDVEVYQKDQIEAVVDDLVLPDGRGAAYWNEFNAAIYEVSLAKLCEQCLSNRCCSILSFVRDGGDFARGPGTRSFLNCSTRGAKRKSFSDVRVSHTVHNPWIQNNAASERCRMD